MPSGLEDAWTIAELANGFPFLRVAPFVGLA
jgi:hypothetical protein